MTTVISIIVAVGFVGFICVGSVIEHGKLLNTKEDVRRYELSCINRRGLYK